MLQQELYKTQSDFAEQEQTLDRFKDEIKTLQLQTAKLLKFKHTKSKRLNELEGQFKDSNIMQSLNLDKILHSLEIREEQITSMRHTVVQNDEFAYRIREET